MSVDNFIEVGMAVCMVLLCASGLLMVGGLLVYLFGSACK